MTPGEVRVTVARVCPAGCDHGTVRKLQAAWISGDPENMRSGESWHSVKCRTCDGEGVVWEPVTCAGCTHWVQDDSVCQLFTRVGWVEAEQERETPLRPWCTCDDLDIPKQNQIVYADADFACKAWEPREPRS